MEAGNIKVQTPRGNFKIEGIFYSEKEANAAGYYCYFTLDNGVDDIYIKHLDEYHCKFAIVRGSRI
jgi:hypothetical protein